MPTVMSPRQMTNRHHIERTGPQKVATIFGIALISIGIMGTIIPGLLHFHLSMGHNFLNLLCGAIALLCGKGSRARALNFCLSFGAFYGILGILGFLIGEPGYPIMGYREADQNLFRLIPNFLELGTMDHLAHILMSAFLIFTVYTFKKDKQSVRNL